MDSSRSTYVERVRAQQRQQMLDRLGRSEYPGARDLGALYEALGVELSVRLKHLIEIDPSAHMRTNGGSLVVYYRSESFSDSLPDGWTVRIVLDPATGKHRRIDRVGFDPR